jgi:hypothetical protein
VDGAGVSALLTWDSKVLTVVSILGGVGDLVRERLKADGVYDEFIQIAEVCVVVPIVPEFSTCSLTRWQREYSLVFGKKLKGEKTALCLPKEEVPDAGLQDFTSCKA